MTRHRKTTSRNTSKLPSNWRRKCAISLASATGTVYNTPNRSGDADVEGTGTPKPVREVSPQMALVQFTPPAAPPQADDRTWHDYNAAQSAEKSTLMELLADLCAGIPEPAPGRGRPRLPLGDMVFSAALKVYSGFSARRFSSDVADANAKGFIGNQPSFNSVNRYLADPALALLYRSLVEQAAAPLAAVETQIAVDSSGFSTSRFDQWSMHKWGGRKASRIWLKAHVAVGVQTNVIVATEVIPSNVSDARMMPDLLDRTAERFNIAEVSADKAYLSNANLKHIVGHGAYPFIPFKSNSTGRGGVLWKQLYAHFVLNQAAFLRRYHLRSNVETTFSMVKAKFGDSVRAKSEAGGVNEILLKFLCHNLVVLVHAMHDLGIRPAFSESQIIDLNQYR